MPSYKAVCEICRVRKTLRSQVGVKAFMREHTISNKNSKYASVKLIRKAVTSGKAI